MSTTGYTKNVEKRYLSVGLNILAG
jgi:hypothetical protein